MSTTPQVRVGIGRQTVHHPSGAVLGYALRFGPPDGPDAGTTAAIAAAFGGLDLSRFGDHRTLFVTMSLGLLRGDEPIPFPPLNVVLEVPAHVEADADLVAALHRLRTAGYPVAIDARLGGPERDALLPLVTAVRIDVRAHPGELLDLVAQVRGLVPSAQLIVEGVDDQQSLADVQLAGVELAQGLAFHPPPPAAADIQPSQVVSLQLLAALSDEDCSITDLDRIVSADPGLSLRVLASVNAAAGAGQRSTALRQALVLLGRRVLSAQVVLAALGGHQGSPREGVLTVLTRARTCELLAPRVDLGVDPATGYAAGALSGMSDVLGMPPERLASAARLDGVLTAALVRHEGALGRLLSDVVRFDSAALTRVGASEPIGTVDMAWAQLHALGDALTVLDSILGAA